MRLFTAIDISPEVRAGLKSLLDRFRPLADMRWSPVNNLHITTKFIGEWPEERLPEVVRAIASVPPPGAIEIAIHGLGWFPNPHSPRVFWCGVHAPPGLAALAAVTEQALIPLGIEAEKRVYSPHLTLARTREGMSKESLNSVRRAVAALEDPDFGSFPARSQALYLSAGGKYTKLHEFSLIPQ